MQTDLQITKHANNLFNWVGSEETNQIAVFIHGFGVKSVSKGLFSALAQSFATANIGSILFNLSNYDETGNCFFLPLSEQQDRIRAVVKKVKDINPSGQLVFIGHSMGCGIMSTMIEELQISTAIMLAPARDNPGSLIHKGMIKHKNAQHKNDLISFKRRNGTTTTFSQQYVSEFDIKFSQFYQDYWAQIKQLLVVLADEDFAHYNQDTLNIYQAHSAITLNNCDHNFSNDNRNHLNSLLLDFMKKV